MAETKKLPVPVAEGGERISSRPYESDFARLPPEETVGRDEPGGGPVGTVGSGRRNVPLVLATAGYVLLMVAAGMQHWLPLAVGLALLAVATVWALARNTPLRLSKGVGTIEVPAGGRGRS